MIEEHYLIKIWAIVGLKENQHLSVDEQQQKILKLLSSMKKEVKEFVEVDFKKECKQSIVAALDCL